MPLSGRSIIRALGSGLCLITAAGADAWHRQVPAWRDNVAGIARTVMVTMQGDTMRDRTHYRLSAR